MVLWGELMKFPLHHKCNQETLWTTVQNWACNVGDKDFHWEIETVTCQNLNANQNWCPTQEWPSQLTIKWWYADMAENNLSVEQIELENQWNSIDAYKDRL